MKKRVNLPVVVLWVALCVMLAPGGPLSAGAESAEAPEVTVGLLLGDLLAASENPSEEALALVDADVAALQDPVATSLAEHWKKVYLDPEYKMYLWKQDDPSDIPVTGKHAFVILGYALKDGEMQEELKSRCDAAAAAAQAFPDSIIVCTGGATGENNPEMHTEAGLMKAYLVTEHGIAPERIFTEEEAMTTAENAVKTFAILREQGIETMTIVTSSYHQKWGQVLYNLVGALYQQEHQYSAEIVGNYSCEITPADRYTTGNEKIAARQAAGILGVRVEKRGEEDSGENSGEHGGGHHKKP